MVREKLSYLYGRTKSLFHTIMHQKKRATLDELETLERQNRRTLSILKNRDIANKGPSSQGYGFSCGHVWM